MTPVRYHLIIIKLVHVKLGKLSDGSPQIDRFITLNFLMSHICNGELTIVEGVANEPWHALGLDGFFDGVQELQESLLEDVLEELAIDEVVHALVHHNA